MPRYSKADQESALKALRDRIERGAKDRDGKPIVYTTLRSVARSGMSRVIWPFVIVDGEPLGLGYSAAVALGWSYDSKREGIRVDGCGMDAGFHLVYCISAKLYGHAERGGYRLAQRWV